MFTTGKELLIVDDEAAVRFLLKEALQEFGYKVKLAADEKTTRACLSQNRPALILMDLNLNLSSGLDLLVEIKEMYPEVPVIIISAYDDSQTLAEVREAGASSYLVKPFNLYELRGEIEKFLGITATG